MSLKAIELQVAIPRTQNVGKIQDQLQQRGQVVQDHLAAQQLKDDDKKRKQVEEALQTEKKRLNNADEHTHNSSQKEKRGTKKEDNIEKQEPLLAKHPFKGNFIDFSG